MEQLNKVELRGNVGSYKLQTVGEKQVIRFTLATNYAYKDKTGAAQIETTWHNVVAWKGKGMECIDKIEKGSKIYVLGRIRCERYMGLDDVERNTYEILAKKIEVVNNEEQLSYEM